MAKQALKQKKKKKWFPIYGPSLFNDQLIGESHVIEAASLKGKYISSNLATVISDMKKQNITMTMRINKVADGKAHAEPIGMKLVQGFVKRLVRRGRTKIDDSFTVKTKEGAVVRVKPLIITTSNCVRSVATQVRITARKLLSEKISSQPFMQTMQEILGVKLQKEMKGKLNKIHPIKSVDIRVFERESIQGVVPEIELIEKEDVQDKVSEDN